MPSDPVLVTCVMPTRDRRVFVPTAVRCFLRQDHPALELVVVDDGDDPIGDLLPPDPRIRYLRLSGRRSVGVKRNIAAQAAHGRILLGWDDDDWHGPDRVSVQVAPIITGAADVTGLGAPLFLDAPRGRYWTFDDPPAWCLYQGAVVGGTLAFDRDWWLHSGGFPDTSVGEDVLFADAVRRRHARLAAVPADGRFVVVRHGGNTWRFEDRDPGWLRARRWRPVPAWLPARDRRFYASLRRPALVAVVPS